MKLNFCEDWKTIKKLFIVYPSTRGDIIEELINLLKIIDKSIDKILNIDLIIKSGQKIDSIFQSMIDELVNINIEKVDLPIQDIWVRDYGIVNFTSTENELYLGKFIYSPSYGYNTDEDDSAGRQLAILNSSNLVNFNLKLDGGNIISNGKYVIITEKIFSENYDFSKKEIEEMFLEYFNSKLIVIPSESLDIISHSDSIVRFIDEKTLVLPYYPSDYKIENRYISTISKILSEKLPIDYRIIYIPCYLSEEISDENIFSAQFCYLNWFRLENNIYMPSFENCQEEESEIKRIFKKTNPTLNIYFCKANNLSKHGGIWNCITNPIFSI